MATTGVEPARAQQRFREGLVAPTSGWCAGRTQANLVVLPQDSAYDLLLFAQRPAPCAVLDVTDAGSVPDSGYALP